MKSVKKEMVLNGKAYSIETGALAKQANGSVVVRFGDSMVLVSVCASKTAKEGQDFFPLQVEYRERTYAAGKIPGGFFKREARPSEKEILSARLTDRPIRPLFPDGFLNEVQVMVFIISQDKENDADTLSLSGASAALCLSDIPFLKPCAGVRMGLVDGKFIVNPTFEEIERSDMDMVVAGTKESITMVEGGGSEVSEDKVIEGIAIAHESIKKIVALQEALVAECGKPKFEVPPKASDPALLEKVESLAKDKISAFNDIPKKEDRQNALDGLAAEVAAALSESYPESGKEIEAHLQELERGAMREKILTQGLRVDGRKTQEIRPIWCEVAYLPRAHGSAIFTRGETQALVATTLGSKLDEQKIDALHGESYKDYMFHYNFPPFSTGEVKPIRGTSRREIGHGHLAERALAPVLPRKEAFPYTIRIVSDVLESNGSSSMASVCGGSLSLMDAGVPIKAAVAGVAMGLIMEGSRVAILSDILGVEDHLGDMDFKVAGTANGITSFQMDIKIDGITADLMAKALHQAKSGRLHMIEKMEQALREPRKDLSVYAPRIISIKVDVEDIGLVIGPQGKMIRDIQERTGATINIDDDGTVLIASPGGVGGPQAKAIIEQLVAKPEMGRVYSAKVKSIKDFGAFVEYLPQKEGLVHISELAQHRVNRVEDVLSLGEMIQVKLIGIDEATGKVRLSKKAAESVLEPQAKG